MAVCVDPESSTDADGVTVRGENGTTFLTSCLIPLYHFLPPYLSSPVPHLLHSNRAPTESEEILIEQAIRRVSSKMNSNIGRRKLEWLVQFKRVHRALLSPVRQVPTEILQLILAETVSDDPKCVIPAVSLVSRYWRSAALSTPDVWRNISLPRTRVTNAALLKLFDIHLPRSEGSSRLNVQIMTEGFKDQDMHLLRYLVSRSNDWERLSIISDERMGLAEFGFLKAITGQIKCLQQISLVVRPEPSSSPGTPPVTVFADAPSLQRVQLYRFATKSRFETGQTLPELLLPWPQLTEYTEDNWEPVTLFHSMVSIQNLSTSQAISPHLLAESAYFQNLEVLKVTLNGAAPSSQFFMLNFPELKELTITWGNDRPNPISQLVSMIQRRPSPSQIRKLWVHHRPSKGIIDSTTIGLRTLLDLLPELQELGIHIYNPSSPEGIPSLIPKGENQALVPKLRELYLTAETFEGQEETIRQIILLRSRPTQPGPSTEQHMFLQGITEPTVYLESVCLKTYTNLDYAKGHLVCDAFEFEARVSVPPVLDNCAKALTQCSLQRMEADGTKGPVSYPEHVEPRLWPLLDEVFFHLENVEYDMRLIYLSGIHELLYIIASKSGSMFSTFTLTNYPRRARKIVKDWEARFISDLPNRRWFLMGKSHIVYITQENDIRNSSPLDMVYRDMGLSDFLKSHPKWE